MPSGSERTSSGRFLLPSCATALFVAIGCTEAMYQPFDAGQAGSGGGAGRGGSAAGGAGGSGVAGSGVAGHGGNQGGSGGVSGSGPGGAGGTAGTAGRGGAGGIGGTAGAAGRGGAGGVGAVAGNAGAGGMAGMGGSAGRGGDAGSAGRGGDAGSAGRGGDAGSAVAGTGGGGFGGIGGAPGVIPTMAGQLVITELMHDAVVVNNDDFGEWFEIHNPDSAVTFDLFGCTLRDVANPHVIVTHFLMPPRSFKTFAISANPGFTPDYVYTGIKFDNQGGDEINLICGATLIDRYSYPGELASIGGRSFAVDPAHYSATENDLPANFCIAMTPYNSNGTATDYGTPGATNPPCP